MPDARTCEIGHPPLRFSTTSCPLCALVRALKNLNIEAHCATCGGRLVLQLDATFRPDGFLKIMPDVIAGAVRRRT